MSRSKRESPRHRRFPATGARFLVTLTPFYDTVKAAQGESTVSAAADPLFGQAQEQGGRGLRDEDEDAVDPAAEAVSGVGLEEAQAGIDVVVMAEWWS